MNSRIISPNLSRLFWNRNQKPHSRKFIIFAVGAALLLTGVCARASNLLVNPGFELPPAGQVVASGWTYFAPPTLPASTKDYWVEVNPTPAHSGTYFWKEWGALYSSTSNNVAGIYQDFSSAPGSVYQANGWLKTSGTDALGAGCFVWLQVEFLGATSNLLALYKTANFDANVGTDTWFQYGVTNACDLSSPVSVGDPYFTTYAVTGSVSQLVAPLGTVKVRYRFAYLQNLTSGGSCYLDDALLDQVSGPLPPTISNIFPNNLIFVNPNDGVSFTASSPTGVTINNSDIHLTLNGLDVSSSLVISGSASNKTAVYHGLQSNLTYTVAISVKDALNFNATANTYFETTWVGTLPVVYLWETEDFDFTNGMYLNNPNLCNAIGDPNCYFGKVGTPGVDENPIGSGTLFLYRPDDLIPTSPSADYSRPNLAAAGRTDYKIDPFIQTEWLNYTRDWTNGSYWVIARVATGEGLSGTLTLSTVNPDTTTTDLGTFSVANGRGWSSYDNVLLKDTNGNNATVTFTGKETLRITSGGNLLPTFFALVAATVDLPTLSHVYPSGTHPFEPTNTFGFTVTTLGGVATFPAGGIKLLLDGNDVSPALQITGPSSVKNVIYPTLLSNAIHRAVIIVTNSLGHGIRVTNSFDTFTEGNYMVEAEDFDYGGGQFVADLSLPDQYNLLGATTNIDFQHTTLSGEAFEYRTGGIPEAKVSEAAPSEYQRQFFVANFGIDYNLSFFAGGDWANYTRIYPAGTFYVYVRSSGGGPYTMYLDQVVTGAGTVNQTTKRLGTWSGTGRDAYRTYDWVVLTDDGLAAPVAVKLGGRGTLRITTDGNCNPNFFMLVPVSGIKVTAVRSGSNINLSFPTQAGVNYQVYYRSSLTTNNWALLTSVLGDGTVKSVSDPTTSSPRFYKVSSP